MLTFKFDELLSGFSVDESVIRFYRSFPKMENAEIVHRHFDLYNGDYMHRGSVYNGLNPSIVFLFDTVRRRYLDCAVSNGGSYHFVNLRDIGVICGVAENDRAVLSDVFDMAKAACTTSNIEQAIARHGFEVYKISDYMIW